MQKYIRNIPLSVQNVAGIEVSFLNALFTLMSSEFNADSTFRLPKVFHVIKKFKKSQIQEENIKPQILYNQSCEFRYAQSCQHDTGVCTWIPSRPD